MRKLELLLAGLEPGDTVITWGPAGSHHVVATCLYAGQLGVRVAALLLGEPHHPDAELHRALALQHASEVVSVQHLAQVPLALTALRTRHRGARFIPAGGSSGLGTIGAVGLGLEIATAVRDREIPQPTVVMGALGTGGTIAGTWLGLRLGGLACEVVGVRVVPRAVANRARLRALVSSACARLGLEAPSGGPRIIAGTLGRPYGMPTVEGATIAAEAANTGLLLEPTYTERALYTMVREPRPDAVFVMTAFHPEAARQAPPRPPDRST